MLWLSQASTGWPAETSSSYLNVSGLIPLLGNHEEMLLAAREGKSDLRYGLSCTQIGQIRRNALWKVHESAQERGWIENDRNGHD